MPNFIQCFKLYLNVCFFRVRWETENHISATLPNGHTLYTTPLPSSGPVLTFILNVIKDLYTENRPVYWQRVIEAFKHAYGLRSNLGDYQKEDEMKGIILETLKNLIDPQFARSLHEKIKDDTTRTDAQYYGANFTIVEDAGTANVAVLAPNGDAIVVTSTVNN